MVHFGKPSKLKKTKIKIWNSEKSLETSQF